MKEFFFILLITMVTAMPVSIGSCQKYSPDGQKCQACIPNYHLFEGSCYVDILGCRQYQFGNICHQCQKNYILVNNMCCDMVCMSKIFSKFKKEVKEQVIASNTQILSQLIPFVQGQYLNGTTSRLIAIQVNEYLEAKRFFLLYEFYETQIYTKRLVVDYVFKSKKYVILDWSIIRNSWKYSTVQWVQVQDDASILLFFPKLYPTGQSYNQVVARKAVLGLIDQYELLTLIDDKMLVRILYDNKGEIVLLRETETIQPKPQIPVIDQHPVISTNTTQTSTQTVTDPSITQNTTTTATIVFTAYEHKYIGNEIQTQYNINEALKLSYNLVKSDQYWNHTVTMIVQTGKVINVIQFMIIGENKVTGSVIKYSIKYNVPTKQTFIVSISEEFVTVQPEIIVVNTTTTTTQTHVNVTTDPSTSTSTSTSTPTHTQTIITPSVPTISMTQSKVFIVEQGCTTHTYYISPFAPQIETVATDLKLIRQQYYQTHPNKLSPLINLNSLIVRRIVVTQSCIGSNYREVAFVQSDSTTSTWEYFTYYLEIQSPIKKRFYLGTQNKTQSLSVYNSPYAYPIYVSDPSFLLYPTASLFYQTGVNSLYLSNMSLPDTALFHSLTVIPTSQKDRHMGKINRFSIDGVNHFNNDKFRMMGWRIIQQISGLSNTGMLSLICPNGKNTQTLVIGSNGLLTDITSTITNIINNNVPTINVPSINISSPSTTINTTLQQIKTLLPTTQQPITTSILTSFLGDPTVQTTNINSMITEDTILQQILNKLLNQKPMIRDYYLSNLVITEYSQALQYHLQFKQSNINQLINFIPTSWILAVVVHDRTRTQNVIISFQVKSLTNNINIGNLIDPNSILGGINYTIPSNGGYIINDPNLINIGIGNVIDPYVVVDVNAPIFTANITIPTINTTVPIIDTIIPSINTTIPIINTTIPIINQTITPTIPIIPTIPTDITTNTTTTIPTDTNTSTTTTPIIPSIQQQLVKISKQQRVKQMLQIILLQLKLSYGISSPVIVQLLQQINQLQHIVKLTMIVQDTVMKSNYSVIAIGQLLTQNDPIIESVKPITQQVVDKIVQVATSVTNPIVVNQTINQTHITTPTQTTTTTTNDTTHTSTTTENTTTHTTPTDITHTTPTDTTHTNTTNTTYTTPTDTTHTTPTTTDNTTQTTTTTTDTTTTTHPTTSTNTTTTIQQPSIPISTPSQTVINIIQQKSYQETTQFADGQIHKIYINPTQSTLTPQIQQAITLVKQQQTRLQQTQGITLSPQIVVKSIQLSATTIYIHYAITIRIIFTHTVIIRRYYVIYSLNSSILTQPVHMGHQDLPIDYDPSLKQNRAFKELLPLQNTQTNIQMYKNVVNVLNINYKTTYTIINIVYYYYRVFPLGRYVKVTIKDLTTVGNLHLIIMNNSTNYLTTWHSEVIQQLVQNVTQVVTNTTQQLPVTNQSTQQLPVMNQTTIVSNTTQTTIDHIISNITTDHSSTTPVNNNTSTIVVTNTTTTDTTHTTDTTTHPTTTDTTTHPTTTNATTTQTSTTTTTNTSTPITPLPQDIINKQQTITNTSSVIISLSMQQKLAQVLKYLSVEKGSQLQGGSLQQYAATQDKSSDGSVNAVQFDFYFLKFISQQLLRQFICSAIRHQADGRIDIALFISNDINLASNQPQTNNTTTTTNVTTQTTTSTQSTQQTSTTTTNTTTSTTTDNTTNTTTITVQTIVKQQQINMNTNLTIVDPNELYYPQAISLIQQDPLKQQFDQTLDFNNLPSYVDDIIKYIRAKYTLIINAHGLRIVRSTKTTTIQRFRIYLFKQSINSYQIYRTIIDYNTSTPQTQYNIVSFQLYAHNRTLAIQPKINDLSIQDDTDIAYGYVNVQLQSISTNQNLQNVLKYLNKKYHTIIKNKTIVKIQQLKLLDGRINYKILYRDPIELSQFKFIIFYQPQLQKVLVLNSVNLPHHSQYNQLTAEQQKLDSIFSAVLSYVNSIHPELSGFTLRSVSKATQPTFSEYQLFIQFQNRKYKSLVRIASNNVDMTQIDFSQQVEISLDHYKLDQFDEMFIMNYQKISQDEIRTNSKLRMILSYLYNSHQVPTQAQFLGAAFKPFGLGFLYKTFFKIGVLQQLTSAQVYIEAYSDKITLKNMKKISFDENLLTIKAQQNIMTKIIALIKQKSNFTEFTVQTVFAKDFLYGTLYRYTISAQNGIFDIVVYHDHSTEEIILLFIRENQSHDQCVYHETTCGSCKSVNFRVQNNKCVQNIHHCTKYQTDSEYCAVCDENSDLINGICIVKANCGALCQVVSI